MTCLKAAYGTRREAMTIARQHSPQRPYRCPDCGEWHTTSTPKRVVNSILRAQRRQRSRS